MLDRDSVPFIVTPENYHQRGNSRNFKLYNPINIGREASKVLSSLNTGQPVRGFSNLLEELRQSRVRDPFVRLIVGGPTVVLGRRDGRLSGQIAVYGMDGKIVEQANAIPYDRENSNFPPIVAYQGPEVYSLVGGKRTAQSDTVAAVVYFNDLIRRMASGSLEIPVGRLPLKLSLTSR